MIILKLPLDQTTSGRSSRQQSKVGRSSGEGEDDEDDDDDDDDEDEDDEAFKESVPNSIF